MTTMTEVMRVRPREVAEVGDRESTAKNILLFFAAPWVGLAYIIVFPFIGFGALLKIAVQR